MQLNSIKYVVLTNRRHLYCITCYSLRVDLSKGQTLILVQLQLSLLIKIYNCLFQVSNFTSEIWPKLRMNKGTIRKKIYFFSVNFASFMFQRKKDLPVSGIQSLESRIENTDVLLYKTIVNYCILLCTIVLVLWMEKRVSNILFFVCITLCLHFQGRSYDCLSVQA